MSKGIYDIVPFDDLYKDVERISPKNEKNLAFELAIFLFTRLYNLGYYNVPRVLNSGPNKANPEYLDLYLKELKTEKAFEGLAATFAKVEPRFKKEMQSVYSSRKKKLVTYRNNLSPIFSRKKDTLSDTPVSIGYQRENPKYRA